MTTSVNVTRPYGTVQLGGYLYIASQGENALIRVNASDLTGKTTFYAITTPIGITTDGTYIYITRAGGQIYQINPATGLPTAAGAPWASTTAYYLAADTVNSIMYVSTGSTSITKIAYNGITGAVGAISTNWSTGYTSAAELLVNNTDGNLYISDDIGVKIVSLASGGSPTLIITPTSPASGNQAITILNNYLYIGSNNGGNVSVYNYPSYSLVSNNWKTGQGNVSNLYAYNNNIYLSNYNGQVILYEPYGVCFLKGTKILCEDGYQLIEDLKPGMKVKTLLNGYQLIDEIKNDRIYNAGDKKRYIERLYLLSQENYPDLTEDLIITGGHSILVDHLTPGQHESTVLELGDIFVTDNKYRLLAYLDNKAKPYDRQGMFDIYHICLQHEDPQKNYAIYANGLLVESCCKRHII